jgi:2-polyprenyl-6-methoxyphenol hydroxylase-like FAD-dependent oxidoreductase
VYDAIIVGAGCAGSTTAMLLARRGYRVLLVDKTTLPGDAMSSHYLHPPAAARLKKWGLLERLIKSGCPAITTTAADVGEFRLTGRHLPVNGVAEAFCPHRGVIDSLLTQAAIEAGAELREGFTVLELLYERDRVTGIRGRNREGELVVESGRIVVGADGMYSMVARTVKAGEYNVIEPLTCNYHSYWSGVPVDGLELYPRAGRFLFAAPTHDGLTLINAVAPRAEFRAFRADTEGYFLETLERAPEFLERVRAGTRVAPFVGTADTTNFFRNSHGPGWALAGDAGHHKDPITAQGGSDAFRDAEALAEAIDAGLSGRRPVEEALAEYQAGRDAAAVPMYELTCEMARLAPPAAPRQALYDALRENQPDVDCFFGVLAGTVPVREFFAPENQQRILAALPSSPAAPSEARTYRPEITCA